MPYLYLTVFWLFYFFLHSLLASLVVKQYFQEILGTKYRFYRIVYNLISAFLLFCILLYGATLQDLVIFNANTFTKFLSLMLATYGVIVIRLSFKNYDLKQFLGIKREGVAGQLQTGHLSKHLRHPMYAGIMLLIWGYFLFLPTLANLISVTIMQIYIFIGIGLEEKKLIKQFGEQYLVYKKKVPMLLPRFKNK